MTTLDILKAARERLVKDGWAQGHFTNVDGEHCMLGAVMEVVPVDADGYSEADHYTHARYELGKAVGTQNLLEWNDYPGRQVDEVLVAFDKAIATLEAA